MNDIRDSLSKLKKYMQTIGVSYDDLVMDISGNSRDVKFNGSFNLNPKPDIMTLSKLLIEPYNNHRDSERLELIKKLLEMLAKTDKSLVFNMAEVDLARPEGFVISNDEIGQFITMLSLQHHQLKGIE